MGGQAFFKGIGALGHAGYLARCPLPGNGKFRVGMARIRAPRLVICQEDGYEGPSSITDPISLTLEVEALEQDEQVAPAEERRLRPRIIRAVLIALLVVFVGPYFLILLYRIDFVRPVSTLMLADLATLQGYDRRWVDFEDISPNVVRAVMMSEDGQFCNHGGVDWNQLQSVIDDAMAGEATRGASTIPMQTAKNLFLWNGRSFVRKGLELPLALVLDAVWPKERTMEVYLNVAEWGPGIYGIEAAARHHFKTSAAKLSRQQAALLAVSLPNPIDRVASKPGPGLKRLANVVDRRARASGDYITCLYE
jgi:monofunctional biosynthetic peptidoglycan transglycosylase